jgi:BD-FAE protein
MFFKRFFILTTLILAVSACSGGSNGSGSITEVEESRPALELNFSDAPVELINVSAHFAADVRYGEAERNLLDIFLPDCEDPTPLVIYIHWGGFTGGNKEDAYEFQANEIQEFLQNCVAYATINYTLLEVPEAGENTETAASQGGVLTPLQDSARALQFLRYYFESLNIEPENVAVYGGSAGAGSSLWLGTHDDMADPDNEDPVLRESTRVKAVGALATQSTYDMLDWEQILLPLIEPLAPILGGTDIVTVAQAIGGTNYLLTILGIASLEQLDSPELTEYRARVDMLEMMDSGDAPFFLYSYAFPPDDLINLFLHHPLHGLAVKARADEVGLEAVAYSNDPAYPLQDPSGETLTSFLMRHIL